MVQGAPLKCCLAERWNVSTLWSCYRRYISPGLCSKDKGAVALCGSLYCHPITSFLTWKGNCWIQFVHTYISTSFVFLLPNCLLWLEIMEFYSRRLQLESDLFLSFFHAREHWNYSGCDILSSQGTHSQGLLLSHRSLLTDQEGATFLVVRLGQCPQFNDKPEPSACVDWESCILAWGFLVIKDLPRHCSQTVSTLAWGLWVKFSASCYQWSKCSANATELTSVVYVLLCRINKRPDLCLQAFVSPLQLGKHIHIRTETANNWLTLET